MSRASIIEAWVNEVVFACAHDSCPNSKRPCSSLPPAKRRRPLRRTMPSHSPNTSDVERTPRAPRRSPRKTIATARRHVTEDPFVVTADNEELRTIPVLPASNSSYASKLETVQMSSTGGPRSESQTSSSTAKSSKRSTSPVKGVADLAFENGFKTVELSEVQDGELSETLLDKLAVFENHKGVVPGLLRISELPRSARRRFDHHVYAQIDNESTAELQIMREYLDVRDLLHRSQTYDASSQYSEAAWNDAVHSRVLEVALRGRDDILWHNITAARISPRYLVPCRNLGNVTESKMVDYAIALNPSDAFKDELAAKLDAEPFMPPQPVNHIAYPPLRLAPICVSIKTKAPDGNPSQAKAQLAVWGAAYLERLHRLRTARIDQAENHKQTTPLLPDLPILPMLLVVGANWDLYFLKRTDEGKVLMYGKQPIGGTNDLLGAYKLLCSLRAVGDWTKGLESWWKGT